MNITIKELEEDYFKWLKDKTTLKNIGEWNEITTPFLDIHNDYLQIYAKISQDKITLNDSGFILNDLDLCGCSIDSKRRKDLLDVTLNGFGVKNENGVLTVEASQETYALKKHSLLQAMMQVHDLFYTSSPKNKSIFTDDVTSWLDKKEIRYLSRVNLIGKSGYNNVFDFAIPKSKNSEQRIIKTINTPTRDNARSFAFSWLDTKEARPEPSTAYAFLNDNQEVAKDVITALKNYEIVPVLWSEIEKFSAPLVA